jgi:hypothetical protein
LDQEDTLGEISAGEVSSSEVSSDKVGLSAVHLRVPDIGSYQFARMQQQSIDVVSDCCHVQFHERTGTAVSEAFGLVEREAEFTVERAGWL